MAEGVRPCRVGIFLPDLRPGGAERLHLQLASEWLDRGLAVDFVLRQAYGELIRHLPRGARVIDLQAPRLRNVMGPLRRYLHKEPPSALLAAMWPMTVIAPVAAKLAAYRGRVVVSEHNNMTSSYAWRGALHHVMMASSMRIGYSLADAVVCVSKGVAGELASLSGRGKTTFRVIYNPAYTGVDASGSARPIEIRDRQPVILAVGTLKRQKRFDVLIEAFAKMSRYKGATLCIVGEGALRESLQTQARMLGVSQRVLFPGFRPDVSAWYAHSDLFVLASDYEGFGNVIVEALEQGAPVVSTDCSSGPREILGDEKYGMLVPVGDVNALARAMEEALSQHHDRETLKLRAREFSVEKAADAYLDLLLPDWRKEKGARRVSG